MNSPAISPLGDRAVVLRFGEGIDAAISARVAAAQRLIAAARIPGIVDLVPAYTTLTVHYAWQALPEAAAQQPWQWLAEELSALLRSANENEKRAPSAQTRIEIPVCYESLHAPDLDDVARDTGLTPPDVVRRHSRDAYHVAFLGFRPGFPYLLGLDPSLAVARLAEPRAQVPAGSVGLAAGQTGIYPTAGAAGWRLIGRTPVPLFDASQASPALLAAGDEVRFVPIDATEFDRIAAEATHSTDRPVAQKTDALFDVASAGVHSTLQDAGRPGFRHLGVTASGTSDAIAAMLANSLVGNDISATVLEMTLRGPTLRALQNVTIALAGSGMQALVDDAPIPFARPVRLAAGTTLSFRPTGEGARAWLAATGGFATARWLGSTSTDIGSGLFGLPLQAGEKLLSTQTRTSAAHSSDLRTSPSRWWIDAAAEIDSPMILRFVVDSEATSSLRDGLTARVWRVSNAADRTGTRLEGMPLDVPDGGTRISAGVLHGSIQVPANGQPILLGPDCQTTGGYPVAGHVIEADLPRLAQLKPGDLVWLQPFALDDAHAARAMQARTLSRLRVAISARLRDSVF